MEAQYAVVIILGVYIISLLLIIAHGENELYKIRKNAEKEREEEKKKNYERMKQRVLRAREMFQKGWD